MIFGSTSAVAATASAPVYQPDPWAALSVMSGGASAVAACGAAAAAAAAAQPTGCVLPQVDAAPPVAQNPPPQPIPVPPVETASAAGFIGSPLLWALAAILGGVGLYVLLHNNGNDNGNANSPT